MTRQTHFGGLRSFCRAGRVTGMAIACVAASLLPKTFVGIAVEGATPTAQATAADTQALEDLQKRIAAYLTLHKKVEDTLTRLPDRATAQQIDQAQQNLSHGIKKARAGAKVGDVFGPQTQNYLRRVLEQTFNDGDGKELRASILDENPIGASVRVNGPYSDSLPLSTMPPRVLEALPQLPVELEFRFVGEKLILYDNHAHIIVDYVDRALPR